MSGDIEQDGVAGRLPGDAWFQVERHTGYAVVRASGEIDTRTVHAFHDAVTEAASLASHVIIDLAQVSFVDSSGLGALIAARNAAREGRGSMSLVSPPPMVRRLLGSTRLHDVFAIHESLAEAVDAAARY